ncbi:MAG: hypothetical protein AAB401_21195 [Acidobacteriota bacterium]
MKLAVEDVGLGLSNSKAAVSGFLNSAERTNCGVLGGRKEFAPARKPTKLKPITTSTKASQP